MLTRETMHQARRVVIKVGTSTLTHETGKLNLFRMEKLARELSDLANQGKEIILVTSGAVSAGMERLGLKERPKSIPEKQAAAAVGQGILMHLYEKLFAEYSQIVAQILLTREDSVQRKRYMNSRNALLALLRLGVIPVINENDAVSVDELKIGDNDTLSATVATIVDADLLIVLSDVQGLYTDHPLKNPAAKLIDEVTDITEEIEELSGGPGTDRGTGGMYTKIQAAKIAVNSGISMVIAAGTKDGTIRSILQGEREGTLFVARENRLESRKCWLAFGMRISGTITVDAGCEKALRKDGSSLLAAGIVAVEGTFEAGNTICIVSGEGREIGRGITSYSSNEIQKIMGQHTDKIQDLLGYKTVDAVVHRDNLVLMS